MKVIKSKKDIAEVEKKIRSENQKKRDRIAKLSGSITLKEEPLKYQSRIRNEWDESSS